MKDLNLSLVICTRNRPTLLSKLLASIEKSQLKPFEVVVVSSGEEVSEIVNKHVNSITIKHFHTELIGQSNQKKLAFKNLDKNSDWVFFLDDDLEIMPTTLSNATNRIIEVGNSNTHGIGAKIVNSWDKKKKKWFHSPNFIRHCIGGKIWKSGRATKYMFNERVETEWLNGVSLWRRSALINYDLPILNSRYAAYEDVIFSTKVATYATLIYEPSIEVSEQINHAKVSINFNQFKYITLWTGYFVCSQERTRIRNYKFLTIGRAMLYIVRQINLPTIGHLQLRLTINFVSKILNLPTSKSLAKNQILILIQEESMKSI
jgi:glycosyltransferase involved in cell wall biosynthesis